MNMNRRRRKYTHTQTYKRTRIRTRMHAHTHPRTHTYIHTQIYSYILFNFIYLHTSTHKTFPQWCIYQTHTNIHTHAHTQKHTHLKHRHALSIFKWEWTRFYHFHKSRNDGRRSWEVKIGGRSPRVFHIQPLRWTCWCVETFADEIVMSLSGEATYRDEMWPNLPIMAIFMRSVILAPLRFHSSCLSR